MDFIAAGSVICYACHTVTRYGFPTVAGVAAVTRLSRVCVTAESLLWGRIEGRCHVCHVVLRMLYRSSRALLLSPVTIMYEFGVKIEDFSRSVLPETGE